MDNNNSNSQSPAVAGGDVVGDIMNNPGLLASLQDRQPFDNKIQAMSKFLSQPEVIKRRVQALKKLQYQTLQMESEFYRELHDLEVSYAAKYKSQVDRRQEIINGGVEPTDEDCDWQDPPDLDGVVTSLKEKMNLNDAVTNGEVKEGESSEVLEVKPVVDITGIPDFWLTVFKNVEMISQMIQPHDEAILRHLVDVKLNLFNGDDYGFTLEFYFSPNEYFTNDVVTKTYYMRMTPDVENPWRYEGPDIIRCKGSAISWKQGKNVTVKVIKKVQKHKGGGQKRTISKTVEADSFFNFFNPMEQSIVDLQEDDEDLENLLQSDFEIGHFLREQVIPRAVLYYTGDALEDDDEFEEDDMDEDDDDDDDDDEDVSDNDDDDPANRSRGRGRGAAAQQDCKQQ